MGYNIGWHSWSPGLTDPTSKGSTTSGDSAWISYLWKELEKLGHKIFWLGIGKPSHITKLERKSFDDFQQLDLMIMYYRWPMPENSERQSEYETQQALMRRCKLADMPFIVLDGDHMITTQDALSILSQGGHICAPELAPYRKRLYVRSLMFPNPYELKTPSVMPSDRENIAMYVGNNYGRYQQTVSFLRPISRRFKVSVYGNWLEYSPNRETEDKIKDDMPLVNFRGRLDQRSIIERLAIAKFTIHLCKPSYEEVGFCTMRWAEAAAAGTPAFVPSGFPDPDGDIIIGPRVDNGYDVLRQIDLMTLGSDNLENLLFDKTMRHQQEFVKEYFTAVKWDEAVSDCMEGNWL